MTSKKVRDNIDTGLWAEYGDGYVATAWQSFDEDGRYCLSFHKSGMPSHERRFFDTLDALETEMRSIEPDLRLWHTKFEA